MILAKKFGTNFPRAKDFKLFAGFEKKCHIVIHFTINMGYSEVSCEVCYFGCVFPELNHQSSVKHTTFN